MEEDDIQGLESDVSESEEVPLTVSQVIAMMEEAWLNEKFAPEILPHKAELVECLLGQISYMENNIQSLSNTDFQKHLHQMEMDRIKFIVTCYLRSRLEKIESYVHHILKQEETRIEKHEQQYLTDAEFQFAKDYTQSLEQHFQQILSFWPDLPPDDWKNDPVVPNLHSFVFVKSKNHIEGVLIDDGSNEGDLVDIRNGSQMIISYSSVAPLIKDNQVQLI